jgi:hypothetical protein
MTMLRDFLQACEGTATKRTLCCSAPCLTVRGPTVPLINPPTSTEEATNGEMKLVK